MNTDCQTETGSLSLCYDITVTDRDGMRFYGLSVTSVDEHGQREQRVIDDITADLAKLETFLELICKNTVTPTTLYDIVEDFMHELV